MSGNPLAAFINAIDAKYVLPYGVEERDHSFPGGYQVTVRPRPSGLSIAITFSAPATAVAAGSATTVSALVPVGIWRAEDPKDRMTVDDVRRCATRAVRLDMCWVQVTRAGSYHGATKILQETGAILESLKATSSPDSQPRS